jgi:hypothetical protein
MKRTIVIALIVVCMVFGVVAYATAASNTGSVSVTVKPNAVFELTAPGSVTFVDADFVGGSALPTANTIAPGLPVVVVVRANKSWTLASTFNKTGLNEEIGLTTTLNGTTGNHTDVSGQILTDHYNIVNLPWALEAGQNHTEGVTYTLSN